MVVVIVPQYSLCATMDEQLAESGHHFDSEGTKLHHSGLHGITGLLLPETVANEDVRRRTG